MTVVAGAVLWLVATAGYLFLEAFAAAGFEPGYSYATNYISDLGVSGPRAHWMHAAFYLQGAFFFLGALLIVGSRRAVPATRRARVFLGLMAVNSLGNFIVGSLHSGGIHVTGAALAIVAGNAAILAGIGVVGTLGTRRWYRYVSRLIAVTGLFSLAMLLIDRATPAIQLLPDGVWERGSVYSIFLWQSLTAVFLLSRRKSNQP